MVTVEGIEVVDLVVMIMHIVESVEDLQGAHLIEVVVEIIHRGIHRHPMLEELGGIGPGHFHTLRMVVQTGGMLVDLGDVLKMEGEKTVLWISVCIHVSGIVCSY